ncbi:MAG: LPS export ABC transporter periplasmic protein LptC [Candidatus Omnitrophica bacterium]|nr:LPS export ABC transporter periplasmic protein LptC [Candidatus Omnitrophota bacterium]
MMTSKISPLFIAILLVLAQGCGPTHPHSAAPDLPEGMRASAQDKEGGMDQKMLTFTFSEYTNDGRKKMDIEGDSADIFSASVDLFNLIAHVYNSDQDITITSDTGTFDRATNHVELVSNVIARSQDGGMVQTNSMDYDSDSGVGTTEDQTWITQEGMISNGKGAVVHSKERRAELKRDVHVLFVNRDDEEKGLTTITCDGPLEVDSEARLAVFQNNVLVQDHRGTVASDRMEVTITREEQKIERIICTGNVNIRQGQSSTLSERAVYLAQEGRVVLTGAPRLVIYPDELEETDAIIRNQGSGQDL